MLLHALFASFGVSTYSVLLIPMLQTSITQRPERCALYSQFAGTMHAMPIELVRVTWLLDLTLEMWGECCDNHWWD